MNRQKQLDGLERKMEAYSIAIRVTRHIPSAFEALREYCLLAKKYNELRSYGH